MIYIRMTRLAPAIFILFYAISVGLPFFNRTLASFFPYPFFNAMSLTLGGIPLSMLLAYLARGPQFLVSWTIPSSRTCWQVIVAGFLYAATISLTFFCYQYSSVDFTIAFSFVTVVADALVQHESLTVPRIFALLVIVSGIGLISYSFAWSTDKMGSSNQILLQTALAICASSLALAVKTLLGLVSLFETVSISFLNLWIHLIGAFPLVILFCIVEFPTIPKVAHLFNVHYFVLVWFGVGSLELLSLCGAALKECPGYGFADDVVPLKIVSVLLISSIVYDETVYSAGQSLGLFFIVLGYVLYSVLGDRKSTGGSIGEGDMAALLGQQLRDDEIDRLPNE